MTKFPDFPETQSSRIEENLSPSIQAKLTKDQKKVLLEQRKKGSLWGRIVKYLAITFFIINGIGIIFTEIQLNKDNKYLQLFSKENTSVQYENLRNKKAELENEKNSMSSQIAQLSEQIEKEEYSLFTGTIRNLRQNQLVWFDKRDNQNKIIAYGILDAPNNMKKFFMSPYYAKAYGDLLLDGINKITIEGVSATSENLNFRVTTSNVLGKVFFLTTEFIKMMNSYDILKDGSITAFNKSKSKSDEENMSFAISFKIQNKDEKDPADENFYDFQKFLDYKEEKTIPVSTNTQTSPKTPLKK